eukprot:scaffold43165_cov129-Isochrysis_galbana.AAC.3
MSSMSASDRAVSLEARSMVRPAERSEPRSEISSNPWRSADCPRRLIVVLEAAPDLARNGRDGPNGRRLGDHRLPVVVKLGIRIRPGHKALANVGEVLEGLGTPRAVFIRPRGSAARILVARNRLLAAVARIRLAQKLEVACALSATLLSETGWRKVVVTGHRVVRVLVAAGAVPRWSQRAVARVRLTQNHQVLRALGAAWLPHSLSHGIVPGDRIVRVLVAAGPVPRWSQ